MRKQRMRENSRLDKLDLKILNFIQKENKINYSKIGKELGMSHVAIKNRFEKLLKNSLIKPQILLNFSKLNFKLGILLLELDQEGIEKLKPIYLKCPRTIYFFNIIGQYNYFLLFYAEDLKSLETILHSCMLYNQKGVRKSNILILGELEEDLYLPLKFSLLINQKNERTPCETCCKFCKAFIQKECLGCPASKYYNGPLKFE